jgi:hypothetical protein
MALLPFAEQLTYGRRKREEWTCIAYSSLLTACHTLGLRFADFSSATIETSTHRFANPLFAPEYCKMLENA